MSQIVTASIPPQKWYSDFKAEGVLNDVEIDGLYTGFYDPETNINGGVIDVGDVPELYNAILSASCTSFFSIIKCIFSETEGGAVNLVSVMGPEFTADVSYNFVGPSGSDLGGISQLVEVREMEPGRLEGRSRIEGQFDGPKDIVWSPGYPVFLRQVAPGRIEGVYGQTILTEGGEHFYVLARRTYMYETDHELPFDEIWTYKLLDLDIRVENGRRLFDYRATAFYMPAEARHGSISDANRTFAEMEYKRSPVLVG